MNVFSSMLISLKVTVSINVSPHRITRFQVAKEDVDRDADVFYGHSSMEPQGRNVENVPRLQDYFMRMGMPKRRIPADGICVKYIDRRT